MKKVLLIGDSIRMGYQEKVIARLAGKAEISAPQENCRFSAFTLFQLIDWAAGDGYDAIHWNNGMWDVCRMPDGKIHTALPLYLEYQERIATILRQRARRVIFATTSPVWSEQFSSGAKRPRRLEDIRAYNAAAVALMGRLDIEVNDLYAVLSEDIPRYVKPEDMVHLTEAGNEVCAQRVADIIER